MERFDSTCQKTESKTGKQRSALQVPPASLLGVRSVSAEQLLLHHDNEKVPSPTDTVAVSQAITIGEDRAQESLRDEQPTKNKAKGGNAQCDD